MSERELATLVETARETLERVHLDSAASERADATIRAIERQSNRALREAMIDAWLTTAARQEELDPGELVFLEQLQSFEPHTRVPHHEFPRSRVPAFQVAARARNLLRLRALRNKAGELTSDLPRLLAALGRDPKTDAFRTARLAARALPPDGRDRLEASARSRLGDDPGAPAALLALAESRPERSDLLEPVVVHGAPATARRALRMAMDRQVANLAVLAGRALERPEIGGVAVEALVRSGPGAEPRLWTLLDDPELGADAARTLAQRSAELVERVRAEIGIVPLRARLRMLLALKLRDSPESRAMLRELVGAPWLSPEQREAVASWL